MNDTRPVAAQASRPQNGNGSVAAARVLDLGVSNGPYGERFFLNVAVGRDRARLFGSAKKIADALRALGETIPPEELGAGMRFNLPCRVTTERSADGPLSQRHPIAADTDEWGTEVQRMTRSSFPIREKSRIRKILRISRTHSSRNTSPARSSTGCTIWRTSGHGLSPPASSSARSCILPWPNISGRGTIRRRASSGSGRHSKESKCATRARRPGTSSIRRNRIARNISPRTRAEDHARCVGRPQAAISGWIEWED